ncbi:MAG: hypothetical protein ABI045_02455 [Flavobacteriales bacterium]
MGINTINLQVTLDIHGNLVIGNIKSAAGLDHVLFIKKVKLIKVSVKRLVELIRKDITEKYKTPIDSSLPSSRLDLIIGLKKMNNKNNTNI